LLYDSAKDTQSQLRKMCAEIDARQLSIKPRRRVGGTLSTS